MIGKTLSHYEIVGLLGKGGMGEVYRARDTRLGRDVAIKVLPETLAKNLDVRARFEREAKTISSLNSPHICVLHDVGRDGDTDFLVMELVEGATLAQRLEKGPLPLAEALKVGAEIADALDRAHRAGVIHRDLKPGNIMLTRSGAKLMDFGLARAMDPTTPDGSGTLTMAHPSQSPTMAHPLTAEGSIVGTFQYMAPEQLEGKEVDGRADLWALGCVLYEMVSGKRAFEGASQASLIGSIMHAEPPSLTAISAVSPPELDRLVRACLVKNPDDRVQNAHDVKLQLEWLGDASSSLASVTAPALAGGRRRSSWVGYALVTLLAVATTALAMTVLRSDRGESLDNEFTKRFILGSVTMQPACTPVISPDGRSVVVSGIDDTQTQLYRRDLGSLEINVIPGTEGAVAPFFSPDGTWIGFSADNALKKIPLSGGMAQIIAGPVDATAGARWEEDGSIYFCPRSGGLDGLTAVYRVDSGGGPVETVATLDSTTGEYEGWLPELLPDGETILVTILSSDGLSRIVAIGRDGSRRLIVDGGFEGRYVDSGHLLYYNRDAEAVFVASFDPSETRLTGPSIPLTELVSPNYCFDISRAGSLVYVPIPGGNAGVEIVLLDRSGTATPLTERRADWAQPRVSPDGSKVLVRKVGTNCELWLLDIERESLARIAHGSDSHDAIWAPDGKRVVYLRRGNPTEMVTISVSGARESKVIESGLSAGSPYSWSSGGNLLAYSIDARRTGSDIWVRPMESDGRAEPFVATEAQEANPALSPDGKWMAYSSNETGTEEVFLRTYPDTGSVWQISAGGGNWPTWSRDGRELYFFRGRQLMVAEVLTQRELEVSMPTEVPGLDMDLTFGRDFDVTPDGDFVAVRSRDAERGQQELRLLVNWRQEMERLSAGP